jgi:hypothetical protein
MSSFLSLPDEKLIIARREYWLCLLPTIFLATISLITFIIISYLLSITIIKSPLIFICTTLVASSIFLSSVTKAIVDWYFHIYIVTSRKLLELCCVPLFSDNVNDVFLDQVRTIEINSMVCELLDIGDVTIVFDRLSKEEVFVLKHVKNPRATSVLIADALVTTMVRSPLEIRRNPQLLSSTNI